MQVYADWEFYTAEYGGVMGGVMKEADFRRLVRQASAYLDRITFGRIGAEEWRDVAANACCAVAEAMRYIEQGGDKTAESNDGVSVTYAARAARTDAQRLREAAGLWLDDTGLLYRGVGGYAGL